MTPRERELLTGMGNCYEACHADFDGTLQMVSNARGLTVPEVRALLASMKERYAGQDGYEALRRRLPPTFPF